MTGVNIATDLTSAADPLGELLLFASVLLGDIEGSQRSLHRLRIHADRLQ